MNALVIYRSLLSERDKNEFGYPEWDAAQKMNGDFYILPSSIHELLAVPVSTAEIEELRQMVKEVNDNEVAPEEILGYEVYRYNRETGEVEVAV